MKAWIIDMLFDEYFQYVCLLLKYPFKWIGMSKSEEIFYALIWAFFVFPILLLCFIYWSFS